MCGRFVHDPDLDALLATFALSGQRFDDYVPRWNIAPTQTIALIVEHQQENGDLARVMGPARWSLVPPFEKALPLRYSTFNARAETLSRTRAFRGALGHHRALIPTGGYYEWVTIEGTKIPHFVSGPPTAGQAFAGLYSWWQPDADSPPLCTATIITSAAPDHLAWVHHRTPVFVPPELWERWLNPRVTGSEQLVDDLLNHQGPVTDTLTAYPVGPVTGDGPHLTKPVSQST